MAKKSEFINDRLKKLRIALEMTQDKFAEKIHVTHGQISAMELKRSIINEQNIDMICSPNRFAEGKTVNKDWLRAGNGEMFVAPSLHEGRLKLYDENKKELPADEEELIEVYRDLMPENKETVSNNAKMILETQEKTKAHLHGKTESGQERGERKFG